MKYINNYIVICILIVSFSLLFGSLAEFSEKTPIPGEVFVRFSSNVDPFEVRIIDGHCKVGVPWFDDLSEMLGIYELNRVFPGNHIVLSRI